MADCVSLPNAAELVKELRSNPNNVWMWQAADAIEALMQENEKLKEERDHWEEIARERGEHYRQMRRERDAAVADLKTADLTMRNEKGFCIAFFCNEKKCDGCFLGNGWEWRGVDHIDAGVPKEIAYDKLVRDRIPEIIEGEGKRYNDYRLVEEI